MDKEENNYSAFMPPSFNGLDYTLDHHHHHDHHEEQLKYHLNETSSDNNNGNMVNYLLNNHHHQQLQQQQQTVLVQQSAQAPAGYCGTSSSTSFDKLSFADVMQFADFGPKLALNQTNINSEEESAAGIDPVYFLKFAVLNEKLDDNNNDHHQSLIVPQLAGPEGRHHHEERFTGLSMEEHSKARSGQEEEEGAWEDDQEARVSGSTNSVQQLRFLGDQGLQNNPGGVVPELPKNKRKRPRTTKTTQEVESQRMTHIAVERNRRKQMNEHLRVLRSLMPGSYVQRGDQASIVGGAIEFVRELEQLLECLDSQKRRRLLGDQGARQVQVDITAADSSAMPVHQGAVVPFFPAGALALPPNDPMKLVEFEAAGVGEETAENKSCFADVEVRVLGFDAMIKILSQRRPGLLIKTIAALEDLHLNILHTNITTIEQAVLYSFNVQVGSESRFTAEDIASSVQQIFSFIHANTASL